MTTFRSEDVLVGLFAFGLVPWIVWTVQRGIRDERLPIGRAHIRRDERPAAYRILLFYYVFMIIVTGAISLDLLFGLDLRSWL